MASVILAADIGGTNCRLALYERKAGSLAQMARASLPTCDIPHTNALLAAFESELGISPHAANAVVVALAGPVENGLRGKLTNGKLETDFTGYCRNAFYVINDFTAQAYAVMGNVPARHIAGGHGACATATRAIVGAGTGLGQAILTCNGSEWIVLPSENGHTEFPFVTGAENSFHDFLRQKFNVERASRDDVIAGRGLACLHEFLTGHQLTPAQVGEQALQKETPTLAAYAAFYGRICRNWMLAALSMGGLYITGGIAAQNPLCVTCGHFMAELYNCAHFEELLRQIPVYLVEDQDSGLYGAACYGILRHDAANDRR